MAANRSQAGFATSLRDYPEKGDDHKPQFSLIPFKEKNNSQLRDVGSRIGPVTFLPPMKPVSASNLAKMPFVAKVRSRHIKGSSSAIECISSLYRSVSRNG